MNKKCGVCEEPIERDEVSVIYEGELCHIDCAASDMDEAEFDDCRDKD